MAQMQAEDNVSSTPGKLLNVVESVQQCERLAVLADRLEKFSKLTLNG